MVGGRRARDGLAPRMQQVSCMASRVKMTASELQALIQKHGGIAPAAKALGIPVGTLTSRASRMLVRSNNQGGRPNCKFL